MRRMTKEPMTAKRGVKLVNPSREAGKGELFIVSFHSFPTFDRLLQLSAVTGISEAPIPAL
jgi:hypothetical protein